MAATSCTSKDLTCTVCLDHFKEPKLLPCCHTFCKGCLERILEKSKDKAKLVCPKCRTEHKVPENGPEEFLTDFTVTHELESLQLKSRQEESSCEQCDSTEPAVAYCSDCPAFLCDFCSQAHKRMKLCQNHTVVGLDLGPLKCVPKAPAPYCSKHPDEGLKLFCKTCQCLVCCTCIVATHQGHKLGLVDSETRKEMETQLKSLVDEAQQQLDQFEENLQYIQQVEKQAMNRPIELKSVINTTFDSLVATLESRRAELLKEADNTCNTDLKEVWAQKEYNETTLLSLRSAMSFAKRSLQCSNDLELITLTAQIIARLKCLQGVEWDPGTTEAVEQTNLKFTLQNPNSDRKFGKIVTDVSQSPAPQFEMEAIPENVRLGVKVTFRIRVQGIRKARKQTTDLDIKVLYGHSQTGVLIPQTTRNKDGSLTATFTPVCSGQHVIQLGVQSKKVNVKGIPIIGAKIRRGPDWDGGGYSDEDTRYGVPGIVCKHKSSVSKIDVQWKNGNPLDYSWGADDKYDVELAI